jgi:predicted lipoprotein with Yx(FWY)xxD motif
MKKLALVVSVVLTALLVACATNTTPAFNNGVLTGANGMTLYTLDRDTSHPGKSVCNGECAALWPPYLVSSSNQSHNPNFSIITRDDGKQQWAYKGQPLYFWVKDTKAGDMTGDGVNKVWHVVKQ